MKILREKNLYLGKSFLYQVRRLFSFSGDISNQNYDTVSSFLCDSLIFKKKEEKTRRAEKWKHFIKKDSYLNVCCYEEVGYPEIGLVGVTYMHFCKMTCENSEWWCHELLRFEHNVSSSWRHQSLFIDVIIVHFWLQYFPYCFFVLFYVLIVPFVRHNWIENTKKLIYTIMSLFR